MIAWFPAALLEDYVSFEKVADNGANDAVDVTFTHRGRSVTGRLYVDFVAERYRSVDGGVRVPSPAFLVLSHGQGEYLGNRGVGAPLFLLALRRVALCL